MKLRNSTVVPSLLRGNKAKWYCTNFDVFRQLQPLVSKDVPLAGNLVKHAAVFRSGSAHPVGARGIVAFVLRINNASRNGRRIQTCSGEKISAHAFANWHFPGRTSGSAGGVEVGIRMNVPASRQETETGWKGSGRLKGSREKERGGEFVRLFNRTHNDKVLVLCVASRSSFSLAS